MSTTVSPVPAPALKSTFDKHLDAVKWVIGLPVAILFGTTQFVDKIDFAKHQVAGRLLASIVLVSALTTVLSATYYFVAIKLADYKILSTPASASLRILHNITYYGSLLLFVAALVLTVIGLMLYPSVMLDRNPPLAAVAPSPHFVITTSGPVKDRAGTHVHTFLVDQNTGEVWRMECSSTTGLHFVRVPVEDIPTAKAKPETK